MYELRSHRKAYENTNGLKLNNNTNTCSSQVTSGNRGKK